MSVVSFSRLREFSSRIQATSSATKKQGILKDYPDLKDILFYTYNPFKNYHVTSENIQKNRTNSLTSGPNLLGANLAASASGEPIYTDIFALLDALTARTITGLTAIRCVIKFLNKNRAYEDLILNVLDKDLKLRMDFKSINKVFPDLLPVFDVALAQSYWDRKDEVDFTTQKWLKSRKLDGCRMITVIDESGVVTCYGRSGKEFLTLQRIKDEIKELWPDLHHCVFDGEICVVDEDGDEHFDWVMKEITKKNHTIANPRYRIFDMLNLEEFGKRTSKDILSSRLKRFSNLVASSGNASEMIVPLEQIPIKDQAHFEAMFAEATEKGWEGIIVRRDAPYEGKRSKDMLKVKNHQEAEFIVDSILTGPFRYVKDSAEAEEEMVTAVNITFKSDKLGLSNTVSVGSGFKLEERQRYFKNPELLVGATITVRWFEETLNQDTGLPSLRFPTLKHIYGKNGRDV